MRQKIFRSKRFYVSRRRSFLGPLLSLSVPLLTVLILALSGSAEAAVNGLEEVGHSWQADMRGGTEVAVGDTALSQVRQPASVVLHERVRFDSKLSNIFTDRKWNGLIDGDNSFKPESPNFALAAVGPINKTSGWGFAVYSKTGWSSQLSRFNNRYAFMGLQSAGANVLNYAAQFNVGKRLSEKWSVGIGPRVELCRIGSSTVFGPGKLTLTPQWTVGGGFNLGTLYRANEKLMFGLGYRSPGWMGPGLKGNYALFNGQRFPARVPMSEVTVPQRVMLGASFRPSEKLMLAVEGAWDGYRSSLFGNTHVKSVLSLEYPAQMKSILIGNLGCDYELSKHYGISAGYCFNTSPISRNAVMPGFTPTSQNTFTCGLRYKRDRWWSGVAYSMALPRRVRNGSSSTPPLGVDYTRASVSNFVINLTYGIGFYI